MLKKYNKIYKEYRDIFCSHVYKNISDMDAAREIVQEAFLIFYKKINEVKNPRKWFYTTLHFLTLQHYNNNSKIKENETHMDIHDYQSETTTAMRFVNGFKDTRLIIEESIKSAGLSKEEQLIFDYIALWGYSLRETGARLGKTKRFIDYNYNKSLKKVLAQLRHRGIKNIEDLL